MDLSKGGVPLIAGKGGPGAGGAAPGGRNNDFVDLPIMPIKQMPTYGNGKRDDGGNYLQVNSHSLQGDYLNNANGGLSEQPLTPKSQKKCHNKIKSWQQEKNESTIVVTSDEGNLQSQERSLEASKRRSYNSSDFEEKMTYPPMPSSTVTTDERGSYSYSLARSSLGKVSELENPPPASHSSQPIQSTEQGIVSDGMKESLYLCILSLYRDRIKPTTKFFRERLTECFASLNPPYSDEEMKYVLENFTRIMMQLPEYKIESRANDKIFYLREKPKWFQGWIELEGIVEDEYGDVFWMKFSSYIDNLRKPMKFMDEARRGTAMASTNGERNEVLFAKELRAKNQYFLSGKTLGELCAVVRLARNKGLLVFRNEDKIHEV